MKTLRNLLFILCFASCSTFQDAQSNPKIQAVERAAFQAAVIALSEYASGGQIDAVALGLNSISAIVPALTSNADAQALIVSTVKQFSANPDSAKLGQDIAKAVLATPSAQQQLALVKAAGQLNAVAASNSMP